MGLVALRISLRSVLLRYDVRPVYAVILDVGTKTNFNTTFSLHGIASKGRNTYKYPLFERRALVRFHSRVYRVRRGEYFLAPPECGTARRPSSDWPWFRSRILKTKNLWAWERKAPKVKLFLEHTYREGCEAQAVLACSLRFKTVRTASVGCEISLVQ